MEREKGEKQGIRNSSWLGSGSSCGKTGIWGTWTNAVGAKGNSDVKYGQDCKENIFPLLMRFFDPALYIHPSHQLLALLSIFGSPAAISSCSNWKTRTVTPKAAKSNWIPEPGVWPQPSATVGASAGHQPATTAQTQFKPGFLMDIYSHRSTTKVSKKVSPSTAQVLLNTCFGLKPTCAPLVYHCLFLSFTAFISYPHQTCEHREGWVTQTVLLSALRSRIRQQNPLISLLFRIPTQGLTEKGTSQRNFSNYPSLPSPQMLFCMI